MTKKIHVRTHDRKVKIIWAGKASRALTNSGLASSHRVRKMVQSCRDRGIADPIQWLLDTGWLV